MTATVTLPRSLRAYFRRILRAAYFKQADRSGNHIYLSNAKLAKFTEAIGQVDAANMPGNFIDLSTRWEGATILICKKMAADGRLSTDDVSGMIPPPTAEAPQEVHGKFAAISVGCSRESSSNDYYGEQRGTKEIVADNLRRRLTRNQLRRPRLVEELVQNPRHPDAPTALTDIGDDCNDQVGAWKPFGQQNHFARYCQTRLSGLRVYRR